MSSNSSSSVPGGITTVGAKMLVALTGMALILFVIAHMLGNLQIFLPGEELNEYAHKLKSMGPLLWVARIGLLSVFVCHVGLTIALTRRNAKARGDLSSNEIQIRAIGERYVHGYAYETATTASRFMIHTGMMILLFVIYHLLHFTISPEHTPIQGNDLIDVKAMVIQGFSNPLVAAIYIVAQLALAAHIYHGASSAMQTLGLRINSTKYGISKAGLLLAVVIALGNISIPVCVLAGIIS
jgi:succinate dehydrogenase / fumarate reductase cytochrome b subunit